MIKIKEKAVVAMSPKDPPPKFGGGPTGQAGGIQGTKRVVVAMSGGVDSSVAAALLKRDEFDVVGVFMKFWNEPFRGSLIDTDEKTDLHRYKNRCCSSEAENRARKVAKILKIPFYVFNFEKEFKKRIVDYFLKEHEKGGTPNPCVVCNKEIKFGLLLEKALKLDADFVATGHYARKSELTTNNLPVRLRLRANSLAGGQLTTYKLLRAKDKNRDQSYFLWTLNQKQLRRILFPIGDYTREEVEGLAKKFKLPVLKAKKSVEICFIKTTLNDFLKKYLREKPGKIICLTPGVKHGIVGEHQGLWFYTIGQRRGIGLPGGPFYVLDKDLKKNLLIVTKNEKDLAKKELLFKSVNWISGKIPKLPLRIKAKIRYRHQSAFATITKGLKPKTYLLKFEKAQRAITSGQSVVFYLPAVASAKAGKGEELLGGGIIC